MPTYTSFPSSVHQNPQQVVGLVTSGNSGFAGRTSFSETTVSREVWISDGDSTMNMAANCVGLYHCVLDSVGTDMVLLCELDMLLIVCYGKLG